MYNIGNAFKQIEDDLIGSMIRNLDHHRAEELKEGFNWSQWQVEQLAALEEYKKRNLKKYKAVFGDINNRIDEIIAMQRQAGKASQEIGILKAMKEGAKLHKAKKEAGIDGRFFKINDRKLNALVKATKNDFKKAEYAMLRMSNDRYRQVIFNAQVYANMGAGTYEKAVDMATKDFLRAGINCVEYKNGSRHTVEDYTDMAIRTAGKRAYLTGEGEKRKEWGISTVIMNKRGNPCAKCLPFVGKVLIDDVWSGGKQEDGPYQLMSEAIAAGLYHPRCKDSHTTYFPELDNGDDTPTKEEKKEVIDNYNQEQKANYCKTEANKLDRMAKYSLDPDNKRMYQARADEWKEQSLRTKTGNDYGVNWNKIKSKEYSERFSKLSNNQKANTLATKRSRNALSNRNGKNTEELYAISITTGKDVSKITNQHYPFAVKRTKKFDLDIDRAESKGEKVMFIHNHPKGLPPSIADINELLNHKDTIGITVGHNGSIYYYTKPNKIIIKREFNIAISKYSKYTEITAYEKAMQELSEQYEFEFKIL